MGVGVFIRHGGEDASATDGLGGTLGKRRHGWGIFDFGGFF